MRQANGHTKVFLNGHDEPNRPQSVGPKKKLPNPQLNGKASVKPEKMAVEQVDGHSKKETSQNCEIQTVWKTVYKIGPGLRNAGNTCFLNSVLQMLTYTSPFANYLLDRTHSKRCKRRGTNQFCALCIFENHVIRCFESNPRVIEPTAILRNIKMINKRFRIGRQEDSQEFLRDLIDAFQKASTGFIEKPPQKLVDGSDISALFGGKLRSSVECRKCHHRSEIFENFFDLSLELNKSESVEKCLEIFFKAEELKGANKYRCSNCKQLVEATKQFSIHQRPVVLTIHLKRFNNLLMRISKISRHISFHESLTLNPYVSEKTSAPLIYDLHGLVNHLGAVCSSGHYYSYVKSPSGVWHLMNDEDVRPSKIENVLKQNAYLLTYVLRGSVKKGDAPHLVRKLSKESVERMDVENSAPKETVIKRNITISGAPTKRMAKSKDEREPERVQARSNIPISGPKKGLVENIQVESEKPVVRQGVKISGLKKVPVENGKASVKPQEQGMNIETNEKQSLNKSYDNIKTTNHEAVQTAEKTPNRNGVEKSSVKTADALLAGDKTADQSLGAPARKKIKDFAEPLARKDSLLKNSKPLERQPSSSSIMSNGNKTDSVPKIQRQLSKEWSDSKADIARNRDVEKIPYSQRLEALGVYEGNHVLDGESNSNFFEKKVKTPLKRSLSMGGEPKIKASSIESEMIESPILEKSPSLNRSLSKNFSHSSSLKKSPLEKLKRLTRMMTLVPTKKRKLNILDDSEGDMDQEAKEYVITKPQQVASEESHRQQHGSNKNTENGFIKPLPKNPEESVEYWRVRPNGDIYEEENNDDIFDSIKIKKKSRVLPENDKKSRNKDDEDSHENYGEQKKVSGLRRMMSSIN